MCSFVEQYFFHADIFLFIVLGLNMNFEFCCPLFLAVVNLLKYRMMEGLSYSPFLRHPI
jgi:hypothetical protein